MSKKHCNTHFLIRYLTVDQKLQQKIKEIAQPTLDDLQLPSPITGVVLESISFGQSPPFIEGCRALREKWEDNRNLEVCFSGYCYSSANIWLKHDR